MDEHVELVVCFPRRHSLDQLGEGGELGEFVYGAVARHLSLCPQCAANSSSVVD
jgi:hypothetical protein